MIRYVLALFLSSLAGAATLKQESIQAWDKYFATAQENLKKHTEANATFLWVDESPSYRSTVRDGQIVVAETNSGGNKKAPSALIHDWTGAAFIPGAHIDDVIAVVRNYSRYKDYYSPSVIRSRSLEQTSYTDHFSVVMMNSSLVVKTAIETDCQATFHQLSEKRWYAISTANRIQEIEDFGRSSEHRLPVGEGGGYLWRLATITRFEERDGGVYLEVEALALSREVPLSLRFVIDPIVRRVSRNSLSESLQQTGRAVGEVVATGLETVASNR